MAADFLITVRTNYHSQHKCLNEYLSKNPSDKLPPQRFSALQSHSSALSEHRFTILLEECYLIQCQKIADKLMKCRKVLMRWDGAP